MRQLIETLFAWGPLGLFILAALDSAGVPIPGGVDALLLVLSSTRPDVAYLSAGLAVAGSAVGSMILFYIARTGGEVLLHRHTTASPRAAKLREWFDTYGLITVFIPALLPIPLPMKVFVLCAGVFDIHPATFLAVVVAARLPRYFGLAYLGVRFQEGALDYLKSHVGELLLLAAALFVILVLAVKIAGRRRARRLPDPQQL